MPLSPRILAIFFPFTALTGKLATVKIRVERISPSMVRNTNTLIIQQSIRWVVANKEHDFVFKVSDKRKRGRLPIT